MHDNNNNLSILKSSNLFLKITQDTVVPANYIIQMKDYKISYYLADEFCSFVQDIRVILDFDTCLKSARLFFFDKIYII